MSRTSPPTWSLPSHSDPVISNPDEDFTNFLDLGNFQLDLSAFEQAGHGGSILHPDTQDVMDTSLDATCPSRTEHKDPYPLGRSHEKSQAQASMSTMNQGHGHMDALAELGLQAELYQHQAIQRMHDNGYPTRQIPPTPNSVELQGTAARYYHQLDPQSQAMLEQYQRMREEQMVFTPLVSPAVTPLDTQFVIPDCTVPGAYFSPLASPALEAQQHASRRTYYTTVSQQDLPLATSPTDLNFDASSIALPQGSIQIGSSRKPRTRRLSTTRTPARVVRQSPSMKPQRRRAPTSTALPAKELSGMAEELLDTSESPGKLHQNAAGLAVSYSQDSSEAGSISPEPLSESAMPPPPTRGLGSATRSPYLRARQESDSPSFPVSNFDATSVNLHPATPASIMRLQKQPQEERTSSTPSSPTGQQMRIVTKVGQQGDPRSPVEASTSRPSLSRIDSSKSDDQTTPTLQPRTTSKVKPLRQTGPGLPANATRSPSLNGLSSPGAATPSKTAENKAAGRVTKKRNSGTSVQLSPALRPRISPSIKPLLPDAATLSAETSALLLASKSNYQNILEGNHLPGVSYPEALSTNLTSKRTSHKIAEQGRRNRINNALQEIASLLPPSSGPKDGSSGGSGTEAAKDNGSQESKKEQQSNSKASTVEQAIEYIRALKAELLETRARADRAERKLEGKD